MLKRFGNYLLSIVGEILKKLIVYGTIILIVIFLINYFLGINVLEVFGIA